MCVGHNVPYIVQYVMIESWVNRGDPSKGTSEGRYNSTIHVFVSIIGLY